jgi:Mg-chelatase subunit ChlI
MRTRWKHPLSGCVLSRFSFSDETIAAWNTRASVTNDDVEKLRSEAAELRAERDALLQKPIDLAKLDSIDEDASGKMVAYYWWQQAQDARAALADRP